MIVGGSSLPGVRVEMNPTALNQYGIALAAYIVQGGRARRIPRTVSLLEDLDPEATAQAFSSRPPCLANQSFLSGHVDANMGPTVGPVLTTPYRRCPMDEQTLRHLTREVEAGHLSRRRFTQILIGLGLTAPMAAQVLGTAGVVHAQPKEPVFTPTPARRGRALAHAVVAGADPAQPALRHRHERRGRVPDLLRAARRLRSRGQPGAGARGRAPVGGQRGSRQGRHDRHLAPEEERRAGTTASRSAPTT